MATLNKTLVTAHDATTSFEFEIPNTQRMRVFVVEMTMTGMGYPASQDDASLELQTAEQDTDVPDYETISGGLALVAGGDTRTVIRIVDLATKDTKIKYTPNSCNAGTIDRIAITFQS